MKRIISSSLLGLMVISLSACSSMPGKPKISEAALTGDPDLMWSEGQKLVQFGEPIVSKGELLLTEGRQKVREGEIKIADGNERVIQSRNDYQAAAQVAGGSSSPKEVDREAKRLKAIGKRWEDAIDQIRDGNKLVEKGNEKIDRGHGLIREGRSSIDAGSTMMRNAQRLRLGEDLLLEPNSDRG